jgi:hypothetical protein
MVTVPTGEGTQEAQHLPQKDNHDDNHEDDEDYTPLSDFEKEKVYHDDKEIKAVGIEAPIPTVKLRDLLNRIDNTTLPEFRIKRVLRSGWEEYKAIAEILSGPNVLNHHKGLAFIATS